MGPLRFLPDRWREPAVLLVAFGLYVGGSVGAGAILATSSVLAAGMHDGSDTSAAAVIGTTVGLGAAIGWCAVAGVSLGLVRVRAAWLGAGVLGGLVTVVTSLGWSALGEWMIGPTRPQTWLLHSLDGASPVAVQRFCAVALVVIIPTLEELLFRGALFGYLAGRWGATVGIVATAIPFALLHGPDPVRRRRHALPG